MSVEKLQNRLEQQNKQLLNHESLTSELANTTVELLEEVQNAEVDVRKGVESQLRSLQETLSGFIGSERANEISRMIDGIHSSLATLRTTVTETVLGKEGEKKWYENIVGDGLAQLWDTVEKWKTSLAFSFGGAIETLKQTGDKEKKPGIKEWLLSFFFSSDEITLTKALKAHNFTSIDLKSGERLSNFILKVKSHYSAKEGDGKPTQLDFFLAVAEKARINGKISDTCTLHDLEVAADAVVADRKKSTDVPSNAQVDTSETQSQSFVSVGKLLNETLSVSGGSLSLQEDGVFTYEKAGVTKKWKMHLTNISSFVVTNGFIGVNGNFNITVQSAGSNYTGVVERNALLTMVNAMHTSAQKLGVPIEVRSDNNVILRFELIPRV